MLGIECTMESCSQFLCAHMCMHTYSTSIYVHIRSHILPKSKSLELATDTEFPISKKRILVSGSWQMHTAGLAVNCRQSECGGG